MLSSFLLASVVGLSSTVAPAVSFGHSLLPYFRMDPKYVNLNHGSYGSVPNAVLNQANSIRDQIELNPDLFMRYQVYNDVDQVRAQIAKYINAQFQNVVFVPNASSGVNAVLRSLRPPNSVQNKILYLDTEYMMTQNTLAYVAKAQGFDDQLLKVHVQFPLTSQQIVDAVVSELEANPGQVYLAVFSHINSVPGIILPVKELIAACHARNVLTLIDGAHVLGHIPLDVTDLDADFYVSNAHKCVFSRH
jgi:selenocysteine lyase/cysteine desulfurase